MSDLPPPETRDCQYGRMCCFQRSRFYFRRRRAGTAPPSLDSHSAKHIVIMVNGIIGSAHNWKFAADQFRAKCGSEILVHCSSCNSSTLTFDGVDVMGHRLAEEVKEVVKGCPNLTKISFVAHSLGGLIARYAIGQLFTHSETIPSGVQDAEQESCQPLHGTILGLQPVNFVTVATPHIGLKGSWQLPFLCGFRFLERVASRTAHLIVGPTGRHLFLADGDKEQPPLLQCMVSDCSQGLFMSGLQAFQRRVAYANCNYDYIVGWRTATFRRESEVPKLRKKALNPKYPHIIHIEDVPAETKECCSDLKPSSNPIEENMISALRQMTWQRVDVCFVGTLQKYDAHNTIQVKRQCMQDGADVIDHMIDNFIL